jgi:hypothetical protein
VGSLEPQRYTFLTRRGEPQFDNQKQEERRRRTTQQQREAESKYHTGIIIL